MNTVAHVVAVVPAFQVSYTGAFQHVAGFQYHIAPHLFFVVFNFSIHGKDRQAPFVFFVLIQGNLIVVIRQRFAKAGNAYAPLAGLRKLIFKLTANLQLGYRAAPALSAGASLVAEAAQVIALIIKQVGEAYNVYPVGPAAIHIFVFVPFHNTRSANIIMMVHNIMAQLAAAAAQAARPDISSRIHQHPGAIERRGVNKYNFSIIRISLVCFGIQHFHAFGTAGVFIIQNPGNDRVGAHG